MESDTESTPSDTSTLSETSDTVEADLSEEFEAIHTQMTELIALQDHLLQRMSRLFHNECSELHDIIDRCHRESLQDMAEAGKRNIQRGGALRVTLGERILRHLEG
jgi:hypothetical protein